MHWYFQRNDKANCSRTVLAFCFIGTSTVSYWWLISDVSSPFLSQTRYCGEDVGSSLLQIHSFSYMKSSESLPSCRKKSHQVIKELVSMLSRILGSKDVLPHLWSCCHSSWVMNNSCRKVEVTRKYTKLMPLPVNNTSQGLILTYKGYFYYIYHLCIYNGVQKSWDHTGNIA